MYTPTFAELAGDEEEFFSVYFNRMPLLRTGALVGDPRQVLSTAELDKLLHFEVIRPPYFGITSNGEKVPPAAFTSTTRVQGVDVADTVVPEKVYEFFRAGATIKWYSVNHFHSCIRALTRMLATKFATQCGVTVFLTPAGRQGLTPHHDPVDLFIVQLEGTKQWKLWRPPAVRRGDVQHYKLEELGEPVIEVTLQPGDVLYLPYNTPHVAAAEDQISLHLSVMVCPRRWSDLLRETVGRLLDNEEFWQFPYLNATTVATESKALGDHALLLAKRLQEIDLTKELQRLIAIGQASPGSSHGDTFQTMAATDAITPTT